MQSSQPSAGLPGEKNGAAPRMKRKPRERDVTTIRFAGDSGDGIQLLGTRFANASAMFGDDVMTLAEYPAEIRAPAGTVGGVSGFQVNIGPQDVYTAGDLVDVLVVMNPAALKANLHQIRRGGMIIANEDAFTDKNLEKAGYSENPLSAGSIEDCRVYAIRIGHLTASALEPLQVGRVQSDRSKNFFALGLICWLFSLPLENPLGWITRQFGSDEMLVKANTTALLAGYNYGDTTELFSTSYIVQPRRSRQAGSYRYMNGNYAMSLGLITAARQAGLRLFLGSYPITPASDILHEISKHKEFPVTTFQAEDEIAAVGAAIGASFAGALGVTTTSGPGMSLKTEFINLAVAAELPLIVVNVQRGGPSTGLPTKMEQADLYQAVWSRHGESPAVVLAASSPKDCFDIAIEAATIAIKYMTPVIILSDGYIANGSEPWRIPKLSELPTVRAQFLEEREGFQPYKRDPVTSARPWVRPGTPGMEHRIGGLERRDGSGEIDLTPENHEKMVRLRAEKIERVRAEFPRLKIEGDPNADLLLVGWGSSYGAITRAVLNQHAMGRAVASIHLRHLNPFPKDLGPLLERFPRRIIVENNLGQLWTKMRSEFVLELERFNKVKGTPFLISEIEDLIEQKLGVAS